MDTGLSPAFIIKRSAINGKGCFANIFFRKRSKIAEYTGELISRRETARRVKAARKLRICAINYYWNIDGSCGGNGTHYVNHSCQPNSFMRVVHGHLIFFALRDIHPGEEITLDYVRTDHADTKACTCKEPNCRGTINRLQKSKGIK
ncbi:MAG: SET domain-containing protein [Pyrinomonadaceae bacterium]